MAVTLRSYELLSVVWSRLFRRLSLVFALIALGVPAARGNELPRRSTNIALSKNGRTLVNVNHETNSVTIFEVRSGLDALKKLAEVAVDQTSDRVRSQALQLDDLG